MKDIDRRDKGRERNDEICGLRDRNTYMRRIESDSFFKSSNLLILQIILLRRIWLKALFLKDII